MNRNINVFLKFIPTMYAIYLKNSNDLSLFFLTYSGRFSVLITDNRIKTFHFHKLVAALYLMLKYHKKKYLTRRINNDEKIIILIIIQIHTTIVVYFLRNVTRHIFNRL